MSHTVKDGYIDPFTSALLYAGRDNVGAIFAIVCLLGSRRQKLKWAFLLTAGYPFIKLNWWRLKRAKRS